MTPLPMCPKCDCLDSLVVFREGRDENAGNRWCECSGCNHVVLVNRDGEIVHRVIRDEG